MTQDKSGVHEGPEIELSDTWAQMNRPYFLLEHTQINS